MAQYSHSDRSTSALPIKLMRALALQHRLERGSDEGCDSYLSERYFVVPKRDGSAGCVSILYTVGSAPFFQSSALV